MAKRKTFGHPRKDAFVAPPFPTVVKGLGWAIFSGRITPTQAIAVDEDYAGQNATIINARLAVALGEKGWSRVICASLSQKRVLIGQSPRGA